MKSKLWISLAALVVVPGVMALPTVTITGWTGPSSVGGGPFNAVTSDHGTFTTWCIEAGEFINFNTTYYYTIEDYAIQGGVGGQDPISKATAWLFLNYSGISGYDNSVSANDAVQQAFWYLEGESGGVNNSYAQAAVAAAGTGDNNGFYAVKVMNLWANADGTGEKQSMLIRVPDGGLTIALLGLGMVGLAAWRRKV